MTSEESSVEEFSVEAARAAAERGELEAWVRRFLASPGSDNEPLAHDLCERMQVWEGPVRLPIDSLHRLAGPPGDPVLRPLSEDEWDDRVDDMEEQVEDGWEPPPVIVSYDRTHDQLVLEDGNHRVESLRRAGREEAWSIVGFERQEDATRLAS